MSASELQKSLLDSIQLLNTHAINQIDAVKSIKATIVAEKDAGMGVYTLKYGGNKIEARSYNGNSYQPNDLVYVLIPDGDFSQQKIILGAVATRAANYVSNQEIKYTTLSGNLFNNDSLGINLQSWTNVYQNIDFDTASFNSLFEEYSSNYKYFSFRAKVKTEIDTNHQNTGNYGLILKLPFITNAGGAETQVEKIYVMDVNSMPGTPYNYSKEQYVDLYFQIDDTLTYDTQGIPSLQAFVENFGYSEKWAEDHLGMYDIHFSEIECAVVDQLSISAQTGYFLTLSASKGNVFLTSEYHQKKTLKPLLYLDGKPTSPSSWECYWFEEDASIDTTSDGYNIFGGLGWKCLNRKSKVSYDELGNQNYQYVYDDYTYTVEQDKINRAASIKYKVVLVQGQELLKAEIEMKDLSSTKEVQLISGTGSNIYVENIGKVDLIARIKYPALPAHQILSTQWQWFDQNGNIKTITNWTKIKDIGEGILTSDGFYEEEIKFPCSEIEYLNVIKCSFFCSDYSTGTLERYNLGTASITITTTTDVKPYVVVENGDVLYKYDADGDSPMIAAYDGDPTSRVKEIAPLRFRVFKEDGSELNSEEYASCTWKWSFPKNSMLVKNFEPTDEDEVYYYKSGTGTSAADLQYTIADNYNKSKSDNVIKLEVKFVNTVINTLAAIKFTKDGESGTNGSRYSAIVVYQKNPNEQYYYGQKDAEGRIRKAQFIYCANLTQSARWKFYDGEGKITQNYPTFNVQVYKDGNKLIENTDYKIEWTLFDPGSGAKTNQTCLDFSNTNTGVLIPKVSTIWNGSDILTNVIQAVITIQDGSSALETIYAYYPIELTYVSNDSYITNKAIPRLDGGFSEVLYDSAGTNPTWDNSSDFICTNNVSDEVSNDRYFSYQWTVSESLKASDNTSSKIKKFTPIAKFDTGNSKNYIKVTITTTSTKQNNVNTDINAYTEIETDADNKYKFYTGNHAAILDFVDNFQYNNYIKGDNSGLLEQAKMLMLYRGNGLDILSNLVNMLNQIEEYCADSLISIEIFDYVTACETRVALMEASRSILYHFIDPAAAEGQGEKISDLPNLSNAIITYNKQEIINIYDAGIAAQLEQLVLKYNSQLTVKYIQGIYNELNRTDVNYAVQLDKVKDCGVKLFAFVNDVNLEYLTTSHYDQDPEEKYIKLAEGLSNVVSRLQNENAGVDTFATYDNYILKSIEYLLSPYQDKDYINYIYNKLEEEWNNKKEEVTETITDLTKIKYNGAIPSIIHIRPIVMTLNCYEFSNINAWDGNKLYIDDRTNQYIIAPQVIAGNKSNNKFTGLTMGLRNLNTGTENVSGLWAFKEGIQSIELNAEDGSATFGTPGSGQIKIIPAEQDEGSQAYIRSGNYNTSTGTEINLTAGTIHFYNSSTGCIWSGSHKGSIDPLASFSDGFYLGKEGISIGSKFKVTNTGIAYIGDNAYQSRGACWIINGQSADETTPAYSYIAYNTTVLNYTWNDTTKTGKINGSAGQVYLGTNGIRLGNKFAVDNSGNLAATNVYLQGNITATNGKIGGWTINGNNITCGQTTLYGDDNSGIIAIGSYFAATSFGLNVGNGNFTVTTEGAVTVTGKVTATSGSIAGWNISGNMLRSKNNNSIYLDGSNGEIKGCYFNCSDSSNTITTRIQSGNISFRYNGVERGYIQSIQSNNYDPNKSSGSKTGGGGSGGESHGNSYGLHIKGDFVTIGSSSTSNRLYGSALTVMGSLGIIWENKYWYAMHRGFIRYGNTTYDEETLYPYESITTTFTFDVPFPDNNYIVIANVRGNFRDYPEQTDPMSTFLTACAIPQTSTYCQVIVTNVNEGYNYIYTYDVIKLDMVAIYMGD